MKKMTFFLLCAILLSAMFSACRTQQEKSQTGPDPLSLSLKIRQDYYNKGNLIPNPSFEQAEIHKNDSLIRDFSLSHWEVIGKDVQLTDLANHRYDSASASQGTHAIKIVRTAEGIKEINDQPEGVLSDYISVIPGNYNFYFDIRLEDIFPATERFHSRIEDGIDIRLKFYDENKKEISPGTYFEYLGKEIDNGFKGFAFSNFFYLHKFGWGRVRGRTWNYPFSEGDLPDNCKYVRIFAGLKCSGKMWIDNLDFRFSKWNFTPLERMDSFFNRQYDLSALIIPTPRLVENQQHIELKNKIMSLVYDGKGSPEAKMAIGLLQKRFSRVYGDSLKAYRSAPPAQAAPGLQVILLENHSPLSAEFAQAFQAIFSKAQGYFIRRRENRIYLGANEPRGLFYAASSLCQLIDYNHSVLDYADITDYPGFTGRSTVMMGYQNKWELEQNKLLTDSAINAIIEQRGKNLEKQIGDIDFYAFYKINVLYNSYGYLSKRWWLPGDFYKTLYKKVGERCAQYGSIMSTGVQVNPNFHLEMEQQEDTLSDSLRNLFSYSTDAGFEKIKNTLKPALDAGAKTVMLCSDDFVPHAGTTRGEYVLFTKPDKEKFVNLAEAQDYLINRLRSWLNKTYGNIRLEFVPPQYNNYFVDYTRGTAETYFSDLISHLPPDVVIIWTGNTIRSLSYDAADMYRFTALINRKPMVWDNSPYARGVEVKNGGYPINYPRKSVLCDLFEPFDVQYPKNFSDYLDGRYYSNNNGFGEINKIKYLTFADFAWNPEAYNPEFSLFKALVQYVGKENALLLLKFNGAYYKFVADWARVRMETAHHPGFKISEDQKDQAVREIKAMTDSFDALGSMDNKALRKELEGVMNAKIDAWHKLTGTAALPGK